MKRHNIEAILESVPTLIYDAAHRVRWHRRLVRDLATALFWAAWIYWMLPLITLIAWLAGFRIAYSEIFSYPSTGNLLHTLPRYVLVILTIALVSLNWAGLQIWAWRGRERRKPAPTACASEVERLFGVSADNVEAARASRIVVAHHDAQGRIQRLVTHGPRQDTREADAAG